MPRDQRRAKEPKRKSRGPHQSYAVRQVFSAAVLAKRELGHGRVGAEHLLIGLASEAPQLLPDGAHERLWTFLKDAPNARLSGPKVAARGEVAKEMQGLARRIARNRGSSSIDVSDYLDALRIVDDSLVELMLSEIGVSVLDPLERLRSDEVDPHHYVRLSDDAPSTYPEQIVQSIRRAAAKELLPPGSRLPAIRRMAETLNLSPGTVSKAYQQLEREGIVVSSRAYGTRIAERPNSPVGREARVKELSELLEPVAIRGCLLGCTSDDLREGLENAMAAVFPDEEPAQVG